MKLLVVTQAVDSKHPVLGFFHAWITELAHKCEQVHVICLYEGNHSLPANVQVYSLGKEKGRQSKLAYATRFLQIVWKLRREYSSVLVHMNAEYVVLAGWLWKLLGKRIVLWYTHGSVSMRLRIATHFADVVCTASADSLRLATSKKRVLGHGIPLEIYTQLPVPIGEPRLVTVGRISAVKRIDRLIEAFDLVWKDSPHLSLAIIGSPATAADSEYLQTLLARIQDLDLTSRVSFLGARSPQEVLEELGRSHIFVHLSATGSLDKAPLEALATGTPVVTVNPEIAKLTEASVYTDGSAESLSQALHDLLQRRVWEDAALRDAARHAITEHHALPVLIDKLLAELEKVQHRI